VTVDFKLDEVEEEDDGEFQALDNDYMVNVGQYSCPWVNLKGWIKFIVLKSLR
jgi:hypothetical protein